MDTKNLVQLQHSWLALEQQYPGVHGFKRLEPLMTAAMQVGHLLLPSIACLQTAVQTWACTASAP